MKRKTILNFTSLAKSIEEHHSKIHQKNMKSIDLTIYNILVYQ